MALVILCTCYLMIIMCSGLKGKCQGTGTLFTTSSLSSILFHLQVTQNLHSQVTFEDKVIVGIV
jgi:hypothetical protein